MKKLIVDMKKLMVWAFITVGGFMIYCLVTTNKDTTNKEGPKSKPEPLIEETLPLERVKVKDRIGSTNTMYQISKVEFSGHTYIVVEDHGTAIIHDPDCKCQTLK